MRDQIEDILELTPMQQGMLFHCLSAPQTGLYIEQFAFRLKGELDVRAFQDAWAAVIQRHQALRTSFRWKGIDKPVQIIHRQAGLEWRHEQWPWADGDSPLQACLESDRLQDFSFGSPPLMRLLLARRDERHHDLVWSFHHLLLDGWSIQVVLTEVFAAYEALRKGQQPRLLPAPRFRDYIGWLKQQDLSRARAFWEEELRGFQAPTALDGLGATGQGQIKRGHAEQQSTLPLDLSNSLHGLARSNRLTVNTLLQGAWAILLCRCCNQSEAVFVVTTSGRPSQLDGIERAVGVFINTLPLRARPPHSTGLLDWLRTLQSRQIEARLYEFAPLMEIQKWSDVPAGTALFETVLVFEGAALTRRSPGAERGLQVEHLSTSERMNYPFSLAAVPGPPLQLKAKYDPQRFSFTSVARLLKRMQTLLQGFVHSPSASPCDLPLLSPAERFQLVVEWNDSGFDLGQDCFMQQAFQQQAERTPDAPAVLSQDGQLTYGELDRLSDSLACRLQQAGAGPETAVGLHLQRSPEFVAGLMGILKSGGAAVGLEPDYPPARLFAALSAAGSKLLVISGDAAAPGLPDGVRAMPATERKPLAEKAVLPVRLSPANLAYVVSTSGSTGKPKGVSVSHGALSNHLLWRQKAFALNGEDRVAHKSPAVVDNAIWECLWPLASGGAVVPARPREHLDAARLVDLIRRFEVTVIHFVPSMLGLFAEAPGVEGCTSLRHVFCGGEALSAGDKDRLLQRLGCSLHHLYGPTEACIDVTYQLCGPEGVSIGRPLGNMGAYLLDASLMPVPAGTAGEIHAGGAGLARGYGGRPGLTARQFLPDPVSGRPGARVYRTGDLARHRQDGRLEFLGRRDHQVKIRGFRVELGEVEAAVCAHPDVQSAAVLALCDDRQLRLIAYVVPRQPGREVAVADLRAFLQRSLPEPMLPALYVTLAEMPRTPAGKLDRRSLPAPGSERPQLAREFQAPSNDVEKALAGIWAEVLGLERVGAHDNFFQLGGDSLLAVRIAFETAEALQIELSPLKLFEFQTVSQLAGHLLSRSQDRALIEENAELLIQVAQLTEDEVEEMLQEESLLQGGHQ